jgi:tRNA synthetases class I (E and Q), anti-codon binding domain
MCFHRSLRKHSLCFGRASREAAWCPDGVLCTALNPTLTPRQLRDAQRVEHPALGDPNMRTLQKGAIIQLERKGYFIVDQPYVKASKPMVLLDIPDGRSKPMMTPSASLASLASSAANGKA